MTNILNFDPLVLSHTLNRGFHTIKSYIMNRANTGFDFQWLGRVLEHSALVEDFMPDVQTFMHDKESWSQSDWVRFSWVFVLLSSNSYLLTLLRMAKKLVGNQLKVSQIGTIHSKPTRLSDHEWCPGLSWILPGCQTFSIEHQKPIQKRAECHTQQVWISTKSIGTQSEEKWAQSGAVTY